MAKQSTCSIQGCSKNAVARGYCSTHWKRWRTFGDANSGGPLKLRTGAPYAWICSLVERQPNTDDCIVWPYGRYSNGYGQLTRKAKKLKAHRVVCEMVNGEAPSDLHVVAHSCGKGHDGCVNPRHLRWATKAENAQEYVAHQTEHGSAMPQATIPPDDVRAIRALKGILSQRRISELFGLSAAAVGAIHRRKIWAWLD